MQLYAAGDFVSIITFWLWVVVAYLVAALAIAQLVRIT